MSHDVVEASLFLHYQPFVKYIFLRRGTNNIRPRAQRSLQSVKTHCNMRNWSFLISEAQRNFHNKLFDSDETQRKCATAFGTK